MSSPDYSNPFGMTGQVGVVTGSLSPIGIGRSMVIETVRAGAKAVYAADLRTTHLASLQEECKAINPAAIIEGVELDVRNGEATSDLLKKILKTHGKVDFYFANAGFSTMSDLHTTNADEIKGSIDVMAIGAFHATQLASRAMAVTSPEKPEPAGSIVVTASVAGLCSGGGWEGPAYVMAKHAAVGAVRSGAAQLQLTNIRVNGLAPGFTMTSITDTSKTTAHSAGAVINTTVVEDRFKPVLEKAAAMASTKGYINRFSPPAEQALIAVWLSSAAGTSVSGQIIVADNGKTIAPQIGNVVPRFPEPLI